ncbi:hypothetical protein Tco_1480335 [Tanacetum coccineum]
MNKTKLEELGLNCNHNTPLSSRDVPSFDGSEPQPLLNSPSLDLSLGDVIGPEPRIKPHNPDSSRMKVVDYLTTQTPPSPHVANSHPKADGNLRELSGEEAWEAIENFAQGQKEWNNPPNIISEQEVENLKTQEKRLFGNENVWAEMHRGIAWDKVENLNPQSTLQVLPSFEENTPPVTYPDEVKEIIGILIEVKPLDETPLEDLGLNTCNHDILLSSR